MAVFNSLGSNYTADFALRAIFTGNNNYYRRQLINYLEKKYKAKKVILTYKGRESLRLALETINLQNSKVTVGICGFTCYAVYEAVIKAGYEVRYIDFEEGDLNFSMKSLLEAIQKYPSIKILVVQNTLGFPCEMENIAKYCKDRKIILIEDLAHSIGAVYSDGAEAGTVGDFTVLSFSQDKIIDGISGGALIIRNNDFELKHIVSKMPSFKKQLQDKFYPLFTLIIRKTYSIGLGRILHAIFKKINLLSVPMTHLDKEEIYDLQNWYCRLIYRQFMYSQKDLNHRKRIAKIYKDNLPENFIFKKLDSVISLSANLRFPVMTKNRKDIINYLKKKGVYVSDIWYDSPIAPKKYLNLTNYKNECPNSEKISQMIFNLPTHRAVKEQQAKAIALEIGKWKEKNG